MTINIAITGASGAIYAKQLIERLCNDKAVTRVRVIITTNGEEVAGSELGDDWMPSHPKIETTESNNYYVSIASGSGGDDAMVIVPCSVGMLSRVANGTSNCLISRGADVMLKERKRLIVVVRENPLNLIHIENMRTLTLAGATVMMAAPSFYSNPTTIEELCATTVDVILRNLGLSSGTKWPL